MARVLSALQLCLINQRGICVSFVPVNSASHFLLWRPEMMATATEKKSGKHVYYQVPVQVGGKRKLV